VKYLGCVDALIRLTHPVALQAPSAGQGPSRGTHAAGDIAGRW